MLALIERKYKNSLIQAYNQQLKNLLLNFHCHFKQFFVNQLYISNGHPSMNLFTSSRMKKKNCLQWRGIKIKSNAISVPKTKFDFQLQKCIKGSKNYFFPWTKHNNFLLSLLFTAEEGFFQSNINFDNNWINTVTIF